MSFVPKPGTGNLFRNDKKDADHPQRPDYNGSITLPDGSTIKVGGWVTQGANGKYLSLKLSAPLPPAGDPDAA